MDQLTTIFVIGWCIIIGGVIMLCFETFFMLREIRRSWEADRKPKSTVKGGE